MSFSPLLIYSHDTAPVDNFEQLNSTDVVDRISPPGQAELAVGRSEWERVTEWSHPDNLRLLPMHRGSLEPR
ncbi:hypothetical protein D3C76_1051200 [compost metagenome]